MRHVAHVRTILAPALLPRAVLILFFFGSFIRITTRSLTGTASGTTS
jgi:hypothetical protein